MSIIVTSSLNHDGQTCFIVSCKLCGKDISVSTPVSAQSLSSTLTHIEFTHEKECTAIGADMKLKIPRGINCIWCQDAAAKDVIDSMSDRLVKSIIDASDLNKQLADNLLDLARLAALEDEILRLFPYEYDDGTGDEASPEDCLNYAADEMHQLRREINDLVNIKQHAKKIDYENARLRDLINKSCSVLTSCTYKPDVCSENFTHLNMSSSKSSCDPDSSSTGLMTFPDGNDDLIGPYEGEADSLIRESLSDRLRPGVECAQWVIDAVKKLEFKNAALRKLI